MTQQDNKEGVIIAAVDDMFFASKIGSTASQIGKQVRLVKSVEQLQEQLGIGTPSMVIVDLNANRFDPIELIERFKSAETEGHVPLVGFLSHVQVDLKRRAEEAGCDTVLPRSAFSQRLAEILSGRI